MSPESAPGFIHVADGPRIVSVVGYDRVLLAEARRGVTRARKAANRGKAELEAGAAASVILCAVAACEATLSEYLTFELIWKVDPNLEKIRSDRDGLRQWKRLFKQLLPDCDLGPELTYRDLGCLYKLRDHVAHRSARYLAVGSWPKRLASCVEQGAIPIRKVSHAVDWTSVVFVHEVAAWAFCAAGGWISFAEERLPLVEHMKEWKKISSRIEQLSEEERRDLTE